MSSNSDDTIRIIVATDNHLGYLEKDPVRGDDSFKAFEEILKCARDKSADMLLLGGDLFHDNKPSRRTLYRTMNLLRTYTMGDRAVKLQILSDQSINFPNTATVNYEDPNYNVDMPIFSIHGNHDDPTRDGGTEALAALDLLSVANLVNYFGKSEKVDQVEIFPVLMEKGGTRIALYGLGSIRDERLNRLFTQKKVKFMRPAEDEENERDSWFNLFVLHQNRDNRGRGSKNCVHESFVPDFIDFVIWGHEHECLINPEDSAKGRFYISQPGSSVATSLVEGEAVPKHFGLLEVKGTQFRMSSIKLESVRPFVLDEVCLSDFELDPTDPDIQDKISKNLAATVQDLIHRTREELGDNTTKMLVRLKVEHSGFPIISPQRFGGQFVGDVANPNDILLFFRRRGQNAEDKDGKGAVSNGRIPGLENPLRPDSLDSAQVEDLVSEKLEQMAKKLLALPSTKLHGALEDYIKGHSSAFAETVEEEIDELQRSLNKDKNITGVSEIKDVVSVRAEKLETEAKKDSQSSKRKAAASLSLSFDGTQASSASPKTNKASKSKSKRKYSLSSEGEDDDGGGENEVDKSDDMSSGSEYGSTRPKKKSKPSASSTTSRLPRSSRTSSRSTKASIFKLDDDGLSDERDSEAENPEPSEEEEEVRPKSRAKGRSDRAQGASTASKSKAKAKAKATAPSASSKGRGSKSGTKQLSLQDSFSASQRPTRQPLSVTSKGKGSRSSVPDNGMGDDESDEIELDEDSEDTGKRRGKRRGVSDEEDSDFNDKEVAAPSAGRKRKAPSTSRRAGGSRAAPAPKRTSRAAPVVDEIVDDDDEVQEVQPMPTPPTQTGSRKLPSFMQGFSQRSAASSRGGDARVSLSSTGSELMKSWGNPKKR